MNSSTCDNSMSDRCQCCHVSVPCTEHFYLFVRLLQLRVSSWWSSVYAVRVGRVAVHVMERTDAVYADADRTMYTRTGEG